MKKTYWVIILLAVLLLSVACSEEKSDSEQNDVEKQSVSPQEGTKDTGTPSGNTDDKEDAMTDSTSSETTVEDEQKQMALDMLKKLTEDANKGKVYRPDQGFIIGKTTRDDVYNTIGESEEKDNGYEHYHGSMGNPSVAFKYDGKGTLEEARYFGTNVERQTNLGGITEEDLTEQLGKPSDIRKIETTGEKNIRYHIGDFELQFIIGKDGTPDHVNLKKWS